MEWTADASAGDWLRGRIDDPWWGTMHDVVPRGFPAYARIFHPATRERPVGRSWPADGDPDGWEAFAAARPEVDTEWVRWAQAAAAFGTVMHPLAQWQRLLGRHDPHPDGTAARDGAGWRYLDPPEGQVEAASLAAAAQILSAHTTTPDAGFIALWEGWGGVTGGMGFGPSRTLVAVEPDAPPRHAEFLAHTGGDVFNNPLRKDTWQPGILPDDVSRGPRLHLPGRDHVLFRGGVAELADPGWLRTAPWTDHAAEQFGGEPSAESPSLVWPDDRAWVLVSEVDFDSTVVGGSIPAIAALLADPRLEAAAIGVDADLGWDADEENR
ncbi:hypothetical protein GCM10022240_02820 [Microbacterium kribbense]|uniref:DUF2716 domain-containing protein n=1 Tax=Microbacterium kribbense TaxID=433645 RepID=A0ABP7G4J4_9MICO